MRASSSGGAPAPTATSASSGTETASFSTPTQRTNSNSGGGLAGSSSSNNSNNDASPFVLDYGDEPNECTPSSSNAIRNKDLSFSIVWSPLPPITWLIPIIGHTGIADSSGVVSDFRGPYFVGDDGRMAFGAPTRALRIPLDNVRISKEQWDAAIREANAEYRRRMHNICCDNCHSHAAYALNQMNATVFGVQKHSMVSICFLMFFRGRFLSWSAFLKQFLPFTLIVILVFVIRKT